MTSEPSLRFLADGPFDEEERATIGALYEEVRAASGREDFAATIRRHVSLLDQLGSVLGNYPSYFEAQSLGRRRRDISSLVDMLSQSNLSNFEMFLPTRALLGRSLAMAEMNFYRLLRFVCDETLEGARGAELMSRIELHLCQCIYTRLAGEVLTNIASDDQVLRDRRKKAALALLNIWERVTFPVGELLPVLQATWEARRRVAVAGGTLLGTSEMFQLLQAGCDPRFVDFLVRPEHTRDEADAFREFLLGATTEQLQGLEEGLSLTGRATVSLTDLSTLSRQASDVAIHADPALAMFEFFLSRHLQAGARRQTSLPGPKRTAEEYVMLHFLEAITPEELSRS